MKIRQLELIGFKSFMNKTILSFEDGITAVVGPNGCGKSNIVDAIFWVMGDQSAKHLRGREMEDVIFSGTSNQSPSGMAEVSITFSTEDGVGPAQYSSFSEVTVSRRLYRSGESEYLINKTPCRLKDVVEFFLDTGVGSKSYSIIEQGQIGKIIGQKPEERRSLIEEAAGILKYKSRKREAQLKMEGTEQNLLRINDISSELKRQMDSLERQAKKAEKYKVIKEQIREVELTSTSHDYKAVLEKKSSLQITLAEIAQELESAQVDIQKSEALIEQLKLMLVEKEKELSSSQELYYKRSHDIQELESQSELKKKEIESCESLQKKDEVSIQVLQDKKGALVKSLQNITQALSQAVLEEKKIEEALSQSQAELSSEGQKHKVLTQKIDMDKNELTSILTEHMRCHHHVLGLEQQMKHLMTRRNGLSEKEEELMQEFKEAQIQRKGVEAELEKLVSEKETILLEKEEKEKKLMQLKGTLNEKTLERDAWKEEFQRLGSKISSLKEIENSFLSENLKLQREYIKDRVIGKISDFISVEQKYEKTVEAVLEEKLQIFMVENRERALEIIDCLSSEQKGRASFVSLKTEKEPWIVPSHLSQCEPLWKKVNGEPRAELIIQSLLRDTYLVSDLREAISYWDKSPLQYTFVTLDGDILSSDGILKGGRSENQKGVLSRKREIKEFEDLQIDSEKKYHASEANIQEIKQTIETLSVEISELIQRLHEQDVSKTSFTKDVSKTDDDLERLEEEKEVIVLEREQIDLERREFQEEISRELNLRQLLEEKRKIKESSLETAQLTEQRVAQSVELAKKKLQDIRIDEATLKEKREALDRQKNHLDQNLGEIESELYQKSQSIEELKGEVVKLFSQIEAGLIEIKSAFKDLENMKRDLSTLKSKFDEEQERARTLEDGLRKQRMILQQKESGVHELKLQISQNEMGMKHFQDQIYERYLLDLSAIYERYLEKILTEEDKQNLGVLKEKAARMGDVNLMAIDEYQELSQRYQSLETQRQDLLQSLDSLKKTIEKINRVTRERFEETFAIVNRNFKKLFPVLFSGGQAELILTDENNLLETGVDIMAKPPGKKFQNMNLLSGGEKALTAISLIFAIFLMKPSPFCLLDEVDAPLDDSNVSRFNDMVRHMTEHSQFIVITHNKKTMEKSDILYGVTMEQPGVSTLISVKLDKAVQMTQSSRLAPRPPQAQA